MMLTKMTVLGDYQTNCYIIRDDTSDRCCIIDPGYSPEMLHGAIAHEGLTLEAILLTHGHFDHVGGVKALAEATGCRVFLNPAELTLPPELTAGELYYTDAYGEGDKLQLAGLTIEVLSTPGHTPGCVCLKVEDLIFSGDTLFAHECGRTDLPGGDPAAMLASLKRLAAIPGNYTVCPGHGRTTSLEMERLYNPYIK